MSTEYTMIAFITMLYSSCASIIVVFMQLADAKTTISGQQKQNAALKHELDRALDITHTLKNEQKRSSRESTSQIAVLKSAAHHASQRASDYEKECAGLRLKVQKLLEISDKCRIVDMNIADVASTIDISSHLGDHLHK